MMLYLKDAVARPGHTFIKAQFVDLDLCILAREANDGKLHQEYLDRADVYGQVASKWFGVPEENITSEQREFGKRIFYDLPWKQFPEWLAEKWGGSVEQVLVVQNWFSTQYANLIAWGERISSEVLMSGFTETLFGHTCIPTWYLAESGYLTSEGFEYMLDGHIYEEARNIQRDIYRTLDKALKAGCELWNDVDWIRVDTENDRLDEVIEFVEKKMKMAAPQLGLLNVAIGYGPTWEACEEMIAAQMHQPQPA